MEQETDATEQETDVTEQEADTTEQETDVTEQEAAAGPDMTAYGNTAYAILAVAEAAAMELPISSVKVITYVNGIETTIDDSVILNNGDKIEVRLTWEIDNTSTSKIDADTDMTYDLKATGVTLTNNAGNVYSNGMSVGTFTIDENGVLHINITNDQLLSQSDITGAVTILGEINVSDMNEDSEGQVQAEIAGTTITVQKVDPTGAPTVNKTTDGDVYIDDKGNICQDYKVTVAANANADGLTFTDTMGEYLSLVEGSFKVDGIEPEPTVTSSGQTFTYEFDNVTIQDIYVITYTLQISPDAYKSDFNTWDYNTEIKNKAHVETGFGESDSTVSISNGKKWIEKKQPSVNSDTGEITWTIVVNDGAALSLAGAVLKDKLPEGLELVEGSITIKKEEWTADLREEMTTEYNPLSNIFTEEGYKFPDDASGKYVIQYKTTVSNSAGGSFYESALTNAATIETISYGNHTDTADLELGTQWVTKEVSSVDEENKKITWKTTITIPEDETVDNLKYVDTLGSGLSVTDDKVTVGVSAEGTGSATALLDNNNYMESVECNVSGDSFTVPLGTVTGPLVITLTYSTSYDPDNASRYTFTNSGYLTDGTNESTPVSASYTYENGDIEILNYKSLVSTDGTKATWSISVKNVSKLCEKLASDDGARVYIYDTPSFTNSKGETVSVDIADIADADIKIMWYGENGGITGTVVRPEGKQAYICFDITEHIKKYSWDFTFSYTVDLSSEAISELLNEKDGYYKESNSATAKLVYSDGTDDANLGSVSTYDTATLKPVDILTKNYEYTTATAPNAVYTIDVNPCGYTLLSEGETLTLTDTLGSSLQLKLSTVKLTADGKDVTDGMDISYDSASRTLTVSGLQDATPYKLSYEVYVNVPYQADTTFEDLGADADVDVSNSCKLTANSDVYDSVTNHLTGTVLKSSATAEADYGSIIINKYHGISTLSGAEFQIHAYQLSEDKTEFVDWDDDAYYAANPNATRPGTTITTDVNGQQLVWLKFDILYELVETNAPAGYQKDSTPIYIILKGKDYGEVETAISNWNEESESGVIVQEKSSGEYQYVYNEVSSGCTITVKKVDQDKAPVEGAKFTLYEANASGDGPNKDSAIPPVTGVTDKNGKLIFDVSAGSYWLAETETPDGYVSAFTGEFIKVDDDDGTTEIPISYNVTVENTKLYGEYRLTKYETGTSTPLSGASFGLYTMDADGELQLVGEKKTDESGTLTFDKLELNVTYYIKEIVAPDGYLITDAAAKGYEFTPTVTETDDATLKNYGGENQEGQVVYNDKEAGSIKITKTDADDESILLADVEFTLYDENKNVVKDNGNPVTATTDENGVASFSELRYGTYYIRETKAPGIRQQDDTWYRYDLSGDYYEVEIADNNVVKMSITNKAIELAKPYFNFYFTKTDESESHNPLPGAVFKLYKVDTSDGVDVSDLDYSDMEPVATAVSDNDGKVYFLNVQNEGVTYDTADNADSVQTVINDNIEYVLVETSAPAGYYSSGYICAIKARTLYGDDYKSDGIIDSNSVTVKALNISNSELTVTNKAITAQLSLVKTDGTGETRLSGAVYGLYDEDNKLLETTDASDASGEIQFTSKLTYGKTYTVKELTAPDGYALSDTEYTFTVGAAPADTAVTLKGSDGAVLQYEIKAEDQALKLSVSKKAVLGTDELSGATLALYDSDGKQLDSWTSAAAPHVVASSLLTAGGTYVLKELAVPAGYGYSEDVRFMINIDGSVTIISGANASVDGTTLTMRDGRINFSLAKVDAGGNRLGNATVQITDTDGKELYRTETSTARDIVISTNNAGTFGIKAAENAGEYNHYVYHEESAPNGYLQAADIRFAIDHSGQVYLCGQDQNGGCDGTHTAVAGNRIIMTDTADTSNLFIRKGYYYGEGNNKYASVRGAELTLWKYDTAESEPESVTTWKTTYDSEVISIADLVKDMTGNKDGNDTIYKFKLSETETPFGYKKADDVEFYIKYDEQNTANVYVNDVKVEGNLITMVDEPVTVSIKKLRQDGSALSGARLELVDKNTNKRIDYWTSSEDEHKVNVSLLARDGEYIIRELAAPYGYAAAEDIQFKLVQTEDGYKIKLWNGTEYGEDTETAINMTDDDATVTISKYAVGGSEEIDGAVLTITEDGTDRVVAEWTTSTAAGSKKITIPGNFTQNTVYELREVTAPFGYEQAESVFFKLDESGNILVSDARDGVYTQETQVVMEDAVQTIQISKQDLVGGQELDGARLVIKDESGKVIVPEWVSSGTGPKEIPVAGTFEADKVYILTETTAPFGYELAESISFKLDEKGEVYYKRESDTDFAQLTGDTIAMKDAPSYMYISKVDMADSAEIAGAKLTITRISDGHVMDAWTSLADSNHPVKLAEKGFEPNEEYVLTETTAPDGYEIAESIVFKLDEAGNIYVLQNGVFQTLNGDVIVMEDAVKGSVISIGKRDESGTLIDGAGLVITDADGKIVVPAWISSSVQGAKLIEKTVFETGKTYTLTEINAPAGYAYAASITFSLNADGDLYVDGELCADNHIVMTDKLIQVYISKQDITNSKELPGAELVIKDADGTEIYSFVSGTEPTLIPSDIFTAPVDGSLSYYTLTEITAPAGYEVAETISFAIDSQGVVYIKDVDGSYVTLASLGADMIVMLDHPTVTGGTDTPTATNGPKTGDKAPIILAVVLAALSLLGLVFLMKKRRDN